MSGFSFLLLQEPDDPVRRGALGSYLGAMCFQDRQGRHAQTLTQTPSPSLTCLVASLTQVSVVHSEFAGMRQVVIACAYIDLEAIPKITSENFTYDLMGGRKYGIWTCRNLTRTCHNLTRTCHNLIRTCHNLTLLLILRYAGPRFRWVHFYGANETIKVQRARSRHLNLSRLHSNLPQLHPNLTQLNPDFVPYQGWLEGISNE